MTPTRSLRSRHQLTRCDSQVQLLSPDAAAAAAAADTTLTELNSDVGKRRQSQLELIKKAKHNRGKITYAAETSSSTRIL